MRALSATDADANRNIEERLRMLTVVQVPHAKEHVSVIARYQHANIITVADPSGLSAT